MNAKKIYYNAPAPLFVAAMLGEERDVGFIDILCVSAADHNRKTGADILKCRTELDADALPDDAFIRGKKLKEKYKGLPYFSIEHKILKSFQSEYKSDEERVLRIAFMAITAAVGSKPYAKMSNDRLLALMSGYNNPGPPLHKLVSEYNSRFKMRKLRSLLRQYYKVSFYTNTRGYSVSLTLTEEQLAKMFGKENRPKEQKPRTPDVEKYLNIISEKDSQIAYLQRQVKELNEKLQKAELKKEKRNPFTKEINAAAKKVFIDFYANKVNGEPYYWQGKDSGQMTELLKKLRFSRTEKGMTCTDHELIDTLRSLLDSIKDSWLLNHLSVSIVNSHFNEIKAVRTNNHSKVNAIDKYEVEGDNSGSYDNENLEGWTT